MEEKAPLVAVLNQPNLSWTVRFWKRAIRLVFGVLVFVGGFAESIWGQSASDRYQLGRRLERFERAWQDASQEGRVASTGAMERAVQSFFSMQLGVAGKSLDRAWLSVLGIPDSQQDEALEVLRWSMEVEERVFRTDGVRVRGRVFSFYPGARKSGSVSPETRRESGKQGADEQQEEESESNGESFEVEMSLIRRGDGRVLEQSALTAQRLKLIPGKEWEVDFGRLAEGDYSLRCSVVGKTIASGGADLEWICPAISVVDQLPERLVKVEQFLAQKRPSTKEAGGDSVAGSGWSTARHLGREFVKACKGNSFETDLPWAQWLGDFEQIIAPKSAGNAAAVDASEVEQFSEEALETRFGEWSHRAGTKWMQLSRGKGTQIVRLEVPDLSEGDASKKRPVLIALHGAGGSENMFFETYGAGRLVSLSRERGWIVVSPRQSMLGFGGGGLGLDVRSILEVLETVLPIDRERVFLVGHSMGAAQAIAQVSKSPEEIRGVAALGGGGSVRDSAPLRRIPFWVGAGDRDFGKAGAKGLSQQLKRLGCEATYREYADVEHMVIVQAALDDVFAFFDSKLN